MPLLSETKNQNTTSVGSNRVPGWLSKNEDNELWAIHTPIPFLNLHRLIKSDPTWHDYSKIRVTKKKRKN